jgi:transcriptional regulator with XRE-family HTH domain
MHTIRDLRQQKGLTLEEVSRRTGIFETALVRLERRGNPTVATLCRLAAALGVEARDFFPPGFRLADVADRPRAGGRPRRRRRLGPGVRVSRRATTGAA